MKSSKLFFILCLVSFIRAISTEIKIYNDGPVTFDTPITFKLRDYYKTEAPSHEYRFKFDQFPQHDKTIVATAFEVEYSVIFDSSSTPKSGNYTVQVELWNCPLGGPSHLIETAHSTFELSDSLIGRIKADQGPEYSYKARIFALVFDSLETNFFSTGNPVKLAAEFIDISGYFMGRCGIPPANITYKWIINGSPQEEKDRIIYRNFSEPQLNNISVIVNATKTIGNRLIQKSGLFNVTLQSKDPIFNLTIDGDTKVKVSEILKLNVTIHGGTPPFNYRWRLMSESHPYENGKTNENFFSVSIPFHEKGTQRIKFEAINIVSSRSKTIKISVY